MKNWTLCICLFAMVLGGNCKKDLTSSTLEKQSLRYPEEKGTKRKSMLAVRDTDYVTQDELDEAVAALAAMDDLLKVELMSLTTAVTALETSLSGTDTRVDSLENLYETATVRQCLHGDALDVCPDCYHNPGTTRSGSRQVTFSPPFHKTPKVVYSITNEDDAGNKQLNRYVWVTGFSSSGMTINLQVFDDALCWGVGVRWMACA